MTDRVDAFLSGGQTSSYLTLGYLFSVLGRSTNSHNERWSHGLLRGPRAAVAESAPGSLLSHTGLHHTTAAACSDLTGPVHAKACWHICGVFPPRLMAITSVRFSSLEKKREPGAGLLYQGQVHNKTTDRWNVRKSDHRCWKTLVVSFMIIFLPSLFFCSSITLFCLAMHKASLGPLKGAM